MPNATSSIDARPNRILALGKGGSGKTTQILTLPKPCYVYIFDPNSIQSLQGFDIDYDEYLPEPMPMNVQPLAKASKSDPSKFLRGSETYAKWETDFQERLTSGFFDRFASIAVDSGTMLLDLIMDRVLTLSGRPGQWPQRDDYGPQMIAFSRIMRNFTAMNKVIYVTGHWQLDQDELSGKVYRQPIMTGQLREKIPLLFSDVWLFEAASDSTTKQVSYSIQTVPDRQTALRTCIRSASAFETVTLDFNKPLESQGIGGLIQRHRKWIGGPK